MTKSYEHGIVLVGPEGEKSLPEMLAAIRRLVDVRVI